jgi:putative nucleotidyltransferase with HDIG domain
VYSREREAFDAGALNILQEVAQELGFGLGRLYANRRITGALEGTIKVLAATVELRDPYTAGHQAQVSYLATRIAREMALSESEAHALGLAGLVHDIGKVTVPTEFLTRPGALRPAEFELIKDHARIGEELLSSIDFPWPIATIVGQHHERLDGSGYPRGLVGDEILLPSRIMAVADVVEAMSRFRPYREALGEDRAIEEIRTKRGTLFDPDAVDACLSILESGHAFEVSV